MKVFGILAAVLFTLWTVSIGGVLLLIYAVGATYAEPGANLTDTILLLCGLGTAAGGGTVTLLIALALGRRRLAHVGLVVHAGSLGVLGFMIGRLEAVLVGVLALAVGAFAVAMLTAREPVASLQRPGEGAS